MQGQFFSSAATEPSAKQFTGAEILVEALKNEDVELIFGYPGGAVLNIYDALYDAGIPHFLARHEQGMIHAAEGYARVTGKAGVVIATSGPGATNLITGLTDAMSDSLPLVVITGQVGTNVMGLDAFQEAPIFSMTMPITKYNYQIRSTEELPSVIREAFQIATSGRPGPVLIDLPKDLTANKAPFYYAERVPSLAEKQKEMTDLTQLDALVAAIKKAQKPVILAGAGVLHAKASAELIQFAERTGIPVINSLLGMGGMHPDHPLFLGMGGMHGTVASNMAFYHNDLLINIGARFSDRLTGNTAHFARNATVAHIDIDPAEIGKVIPTHIGIVADAKEALTKLLAEPLEKGDLSEWYAFLREQKEEYPLWYEKDDNVLKPQQVIEMINELTNGEATITTDVGQHQMWAAQFYQFRRPNRWVTSGGLGTMGFGFPAAIGAQLANRDELVVAIVGDAGFQMTLQELAMLTDYQLPIKIVIINNQALGMVRQWQEIFYSSRFSQSLIPNQPDYVKLAESYGIKGYRIHNVQEAYATLQEAFALDGPALIDCRVNPMENVYPMVAPGKGAHEMEGTKPPLRGVKTS